LLAERVNALASVRELFFTFRHSYFQAFSLFSS
jgi:hypothetical protein